MGILEFCIILSFYFETLSSEPCKRGNFSRRKRTDKTEGLIILLIVCETESYFLAIYTTGNFDEVNFRLSVTYRAFV